MTIVRRPSPYGEIMNLRQAMDPLFDDDDRPFRRHIRITPVTDGHGQRPSDLPTETRA
jgi:hypothetical protein